MLPYGISRRASQTLQLERGAAWRERQLEALELAGEIGVELRLRVEEQRLGAPRLGRRSRTRCRSGGRPRRSAGAGRSGSRRCARHPRYSRSPDPRPACPKTANEACEDGCRDRGLRALLPLHAESRSALRRLLRRGRDLHRRLLPPELPRPAAEPPQRAPAPAVPPRRRRRAFARASAATPTPHPARPHGIGARTWPAAPCRLIADGAVDREGVSGLASRLHFSERQLNRILVSELGAGPVALARAQRAQTARTLIQSTDLPFGQVALGAGFRSVRQFNDTVRAVYARTPSELRRRGRARARRVGRDPAAAALPRAVRRRLADRLSRGPRDPGRRGGGGIHLPALALARAWRRDRLAHAGRALRPLRAAPRRPA